MSVLVGKNNAGKSTIIEALRILSICQRRASKASYVRAPDWLEGLSPGAGFTFKTDTLDLDLRTIHRNFELDEVAIIRARLSNNVKIDVFIGRDEFELFCRITTGRSTVTSQGQARLANLGSIRVMPPVGSLIPSERLLNEKYVLQNLDGRRAHRHFRNQLHLMKDGFDIFRDRAAGTWRGIAISDLELTDTGEFAIMIREGPHTSEAAWIGSGLQAWMQTIWFISRVPPDSIIVLDEPDVYLHSDVQRKLIKLLFGSEFRQTILATHSADIISDVPPNYVVVVDKRAESSRPLTTNPALQDVLSELGSGHNVQLSKLGAQGKIIFVEGDDASYLSDVAAKIGANSLENFMLLPVFSLAGKSNWHRAVGTAQVLKASSSGQLITYALLDGDYLSDNEKIKMKKGAAEVGLQLHILDRYEIENYFLCSETICDYINRQSSDDLCTAAEIEALISETVADLRHSALLKIGDQLQTKKKGFVSSIYEEAEVWLEGEISKGRKISEIIPGKDMFRGMTIKCTDKYGVSFGPQSISKRMSLSRIPSELMNFVNLLV